MRDFLKTIAYACLAIGLLVAMVFVVPYTRLQVLKLWGTEYESVKTDIYRENKSYVEGTVRDLREMRVEYDKATDGHKSALASLALMRAGELDYDRLPLDVREFLTELREKR